MCAISYLKYVCYLFLFKSIKVSLSDEVAYLAPPDISSSPPSPLQSWRRISFPQPVVVCGLPRSWWPWSWVVCLEIKVSPFWLVGSSLVHCARQMSHQVALTIIITITTHFHFLLNWADTHGNHHRSHLLGWQSSLLPHPQSRQLSPGVLLSKNS